MIKFISTLVILLVYSGIMFITHTMDAVVKGDVSVVQLQDSNTAYAVSSTVVNGYDLIYTAVTLLTIVLLFGIWWRPSKKISSTPSTSAAVAFALFAITIVPSYGYHERVDAPEWVNIAPNQSAFLIPVVGANKTGQAQFGSQEYLQDNKVAAKRIQIPHTTVQERTSASGVFGSVANWDVFVPAAQLFIVDRTPFTRNWTKEANTGTSTNDESFNVESAESLNIGVDITISAEVTEENAALFFYHYGCDPIPGDPSDPNVIYASVVHGKSLEEVMDTYVHGKVQSELAKGFGSMKMVDALAHKTDIINAVEKSCKDFFASTGITINYVGYASNLREDQDIQEAINKVFVAQEKAQELAYLQPVIQVQQLQANIAVTNAYAAAIPDFTNKWNGAFPALPNWVVLPSDLTKSLGSLWSPKTIDSPPTLKP